MLASSTPDALWSAPSLRLFRPAALSCSEITRGRLLDRCSMTVPAGTRLLLVAEPEESGSTLLRVLAGLTRPDRGRVEIAGLDASAGESRARRVAYLGPAPGIRNWMTPREALALAADLLELAPGEAARQAALVIEWARIPADQLDRPMSRGGPPLLQRTGLAAALLGDPEVVLLDEPLRAIEAAERTRLLRLPGRRRTVILASRYPASEAGLVTHLGLLRRGRMALIARIGELQAAGLPLSSRGIGALAELRAAAAAGGPGRTPDRS